MLRRNRAKAAPHIPPPETRHFSVSNFLFHPHFKTHRIAVVAHLILAALVTPFIVRELSQPYGPARAAQITTTTYASIDTQVYAGSATTNYGTQTTVVAQGWSTTFAKRVLVKFDLSYIPAGATINSATLKLFQSGSYFSPSAQSVHRLTHSWTSAGATWNKYDGTTNWTTAGGDYNSTATDSGAKSGAANGTEVDFTVTTDVAAFAAGTYTNNGWVIKMTTESGSQNYMTYHSLESATTGYRPQLTVVYTEATAGPTVTANSASQKTDGTRAVDISTTVSDSGNANSKMAVYYVSQTGGSCGDDEVYITKATIDTTSANVSASVTPNPDVNNSNAYQIGTATPIKTTSANTVQFDWLSGTDLPSVIGSYCLAFMGNNGSADSATTSISVTLDNLSLSWSDAWNQNINVGSVDGTWRGETASDESGRSVAVLGDINNDGYNDFAIGAPYNDDAYSDAGQVYIIFGTSTAFSQDVSLSSAGASYTGAWTNEYAGWDVAGVGDVNNDGYDDFAIGAKQAFGYSNVGAGGRAYLILGKASGWAMNTSLSSADASYLGESASDNAGSTVAPAGDVNNDGYDDFLVGAPGNSETFSNAGQTYLIFGKASSWTTGVSLASADASFKGEGASSYSGLRGSLSGVGDVNGDGYDDIGIGEPYYGTGRVYVFFGKASGWTMDTAMSTADAGYVGETASDSAGFTVAPTGDVNNDGYDDFLIGAIGRDDGYTDAGQVYIIRGKASSWSTGVNLSGANGSFKGEGDSDQLGYGASKPLFDGSNFNSDLNGDGYDDIILSAPYNQERSSTADHGQVYVFFGTSTAFSMDTSVSTASSSFWGETTSDYLGWSVAVGDVNNDGGADILMSSMQNDDAASSAGQSYLVLSPGSNNAAPSVSVNSATQKNDGSGTVDVSVSVGDAENNSSKLKILYALRTGGTCGDETFSTKATLDETAGNVSASVTPKPDVENDNTYQVGTVTSILTSATNTVQFDWSSKTDITTGNAAYCLAFTPNDGIRDGTTVYQSVTIDNVPPTSPGALTVNTTSTQSVTFNFGSQTTETNFLEYKIHYRTGSSGVLSSDSALTSSTVSGLGSSSFGGASTAQLTGLATSTQYVARIFAYDSYGNVASSTSEISFYTLATAPGTPTVSVSSTATSSLVLVVDQATNPSNVTYSICRTTDGSSCASGGYVQANGSLGASAVWQSYSAWGGSSGLSIIGLSSNTSYRFLVKARNPSYDETSFSTASTAVATLAGPVTGATVVNASTTSTMQLTLSWTNADQSGMKIERDNACDGSYDVTLYDSTGTNDSSPTTTSSDLSANTCYVFRISSYNSSGVVNSTHRATTAQITTPPAQVTGLAASSAETTSITWGWTAVTGATSYYVYNSTNGLIGTVTAPTVSYTQSGLSPNAQYSVTVRAASSNGTGIQSSSASSYTDATAPTGLDHTNQTASAMRWTWTNSGQSGFFARDKNATGNTSDWTTNAYWDHSGLSANTSYTMEVKARNASNEETSYSELTRYTSQNTPSSLSFSSTTASSITVVADGTYNNQGIGSSLIHFDNGVGTTQDVTSGASWTNTGLSPNTQYTYTAYATNGDGDQTSSATNSKYTQANVPGTITAAVSSASAVALTLNRNSNPVSTNVILQETTTGSYVDTAARSLTGDISDFDTFTNWGTVTVGDLSPNTSYRFVAAAKNGDNVLTTSSTASTAVYTYANAPGAPTVSAVAATTMTLVLDNNSNPASTEYALYESGTGQYVSSGLTLASTPVWQTTSTWSTLTVTGLTPNTSYTFLAAAKNGDGITTASTTASSTYTAAAVPGTPTLITDSSSQITATWTDSSNPAGTEYYVENTSNGTNSGWITQLSWASTNLSCGRTYTFTVKARNSSGTETNNTDGVSAQTSSCSTGGGGGKRRIVQQSASTDVFKGISVRINNGDETTATRNVSVQLNGGTAPLRMMVSEHPYFAGVGQEPFATSKSMTLSAGEGVKTVYAKFYATSGVESDTVSDSILYTTSAVSSTPITSEVATTTELQVVDTPVVTSPAENDVITTLPFQVAGTAMPGSTVVIKIAGTEYGVPLTASSTTFNVTVLDQLLAGPYDIHVFAKVGEVVSGETVRHIMYTPPAPEPEPEELPVPEEPLPPEPEPKIPSAETPPAEPAPSPVKPVPKEEAASPTVEEVEKKVTEVAKERPSFLLVMRDTSADFNRQQVDGIEAVQGEKLKVLIRPPKEVKSITARLYHADNGTPSSLGYSAKPSLWQRVRGLLGVPVASAAEEINKDTWVAGYLFSPNKTALEAFEQDVTVPSNLPAGAYKLVITMNGADGSRVQMAKVIQALPQGVVAGVNESPVREATVSVFRRDPDTGEFALWHGSAFGEQNPQTVSENGAYAVHVPAGEYYLVVDAPLHDIYQSGILVLKEPGIINQNIVLQGHEPDMWYRFISWLIGLFGKV